MAQSTAGSAALPLFAPPRRPRGYSRPARPADDIRNRLRELLRDLRISQTEICRRLTAETPRQPWQPSRLSKLINGRLPFTIDDLTRICDVTGISRVELCRQQGREFLLLRQSPDFATHMNYILSQVNRDQLARAALRARQAQVRLRTRRRVRDDDD
jgi:transcriptional regulator with XRE-family HTH domain